eukprot:TRINITY_DN25111_c0_g1_i1.p1 TRINITY_DN25111_c0_g1~~TRINITY_DN25111_c0_g1_i1.p1  ORF type:complete len:492 (-),score=63.53 TRINITY_DN25111_c0_g1_i1:327-1802(-)
MAYCAGGQGRQAARTVDKRLRPLSDTFVSISDTVSGAGSCAVRSHSYNGYTTYQQSKLKMEEEIVSARKVQLPKLLGSRTEKVPRRLEAVCRRSWCDVEEDIDSEPSFMPCGPDAFFDAAPEADTGVGFGAQHVRSTSYAMTAWTSSTDSVHYDGVQMPAEATPTMQLHGHATSCSPMSSSLAVPPVQAPAERPQPVTLALACALTPETPLSGNMSVTPSGFHIGRTMTAPTPFPSGAYEQRQRQVGPPPRHVHVGAPVSAPSVRSAFDATIDAQPPVPSPKADFLVTLPTPATPTSASTPSGHRPVPQGRYLCTVPPQTPKTPLSTQDVEPLRMSRSTIRPAVDTTSFHLLSSVDDEARGDRGNSSKTTVMLRNLPIFLTQRRLLEELDTTGFRGLYDFCYMPCCFESGHGKGFAFVNFALPEHAASFMNSWGATRKFGVTQGQPSLNISYADIQGKDANTAKWDNQRLRRVRNPKLRPFIAELGVARSQ